MKKFLLTLAALALFACVAILAVAELNYRLALSDTSHRSDGSDLGNAEIMWEYGFIEDDGFMYEPTIQDKLYALVAPEIKPFAPIEYTYDSVQRWYSVTVSDGIDTIRYECMTAEEFLILLNDNK